MGEVCFNTAMTGYQEILTDPSYMAQIVTFTFPHVGVAGVNREDVEQFGREHGVAAGGSESSFGGARTTARGADVPRPAHRSRQLARRDGGAGGGLGRLDGGARRRRPVRGWIRAR